MDNEGKKKKKEGGIGWIIIYIVVFIAFIGIGFAVSFVMPHLITHERTIDVNMLKSEVKQINELATYQYDYRGTIDNTSSQKMIASISLKKRFIMTFDGIIKAGINLNDVEYDVQKPAKGSDEPLVINVKIPEATILSHEDNNPKTVYEEGMKSEGIGQIRNAEIKKKKEAKEAEFISNGNLDKARGQAKEVIKDFIQSSYGDDIVVEFEDK